MTDLIKSKLSDGVLELSFNRPEKKNALTQPMYAALATALESVASDSSIKVVHLTGTGDAFTAGNDIADFARTDQAGEELPVHRFVRVLPQLRVPIVAAVNGLAIGVGTTLLLHCDFVYASEAATFHTPFVDLALVPEAGSSLLMPRQMGYLNAARMLLLGEKLDAHQAQTVGLVSEVLAPDRLLPVSLATAASLAAKPPAALRAAKKLLRMDPEPLAARMELELEMFSEALQSPEAAEAFDAFFTKRAPDFSCFS
jgi:enoyl-CoA hydratase/carnithine racemase